MNNAKPHDHFIYLPDSYEHYVFCAEKYRAYNLLSYSDELDIDLNPKKLEKLNLVAQATYEFTFFEAKRPQFFKIDNIPSDVQTYHSYLQNLLDDLDIKNETDEKAYNHIIKNKVSSKKKQTFSLNEIPINKNYLDGCIANKQDKIHVGLQISLSNIKVAQLSKDENGGYEKYRNLKEFDKPTQNAIHALKPERFFNILAAYHNGEDFNEGDIEQCLFSLKDLIEDANECVYLKQHVYEELLNKIAYLCYLRREKEISKEFLKKANDFILFRRKTLLNPVVEVIGLFFDDLIDDLRLNNGVIECAHCHLLATYFRNKKFCSETCLKRFYSRKDYYKNREQRLSVRRAWIQKTRKEIPDY